MMRRISAIMLGFLIATVRFLWVQDKDIVVTKYKHKSKNIPKNFSGFKMTQVSDYHNAYFGFKGKQLLKKVKSTQPDIILLTGDVIDRRTPNERRSIRMIKNLMDIAPVFYVTGNHEAFYNGFSEFYKQIIKTGVNNVSECDFKITRGNESINITGVHDLRVLGDLETNSNLYEQYELLLNKRLSKIDSNFTIMLAHRPELIHMYSKYPVNLVFSGHAHGGQIRLPYIKGLYAPDQGTLPQYTEGLHYVSTTALYISRGLGNSRFPWRVFNKPEIVVVELKH